MQNEIKITETALRTEVIWGAPQIADFLGLSVDAVYDLAKDPNCPIYKPSNRYAALRSELWRWFRTK